MEGFLTAVSPFLFPVLAIANLLAILLLFPLWKKTRSLSCLLLMIVSVGLVYDPTMIALGKAIGQGDLLRGLNLGRYVAHGLLLPLNFMIAMDIMRKADIRWVTPWLMKACWGLSALFSIFGLLGAFSVALVPTDLLGVLRYAIDRAASPGWSTLSTIIPSMLGMIMFLVAGVLVWRRGKTPWVFVGGLAMGIFGAMQGPYAFMTSAVGETILIFSILAYEKYMQKAPAAQPAPAVNMGNQNLA
jgi:hypothetical protein